MDPQRTSYDPTLFAGTAWHYARYRPDYPQPLFAHFAAAYDLDGSGRALDLGCGAGQLTFGLAPYFAQIIGMDPDLEMLHEARRAAGDAGLANLQFIAGSSWDLAPSLGAFRLVTMGDAFHWMDRDAVLHTLYELLTPGGGVAIVSHTLATPEGYQELVDATLKRFLGEKRRAGQGYYSHPPERHEVVLRRSAFTMLAPWSYERRQNWSVAQILGYLYSTSYAARRLFGDQIEHFESELTRRLLELNPDGTFAFRITTSALLGMKRAG